MSSSNITKLTLEERLARLREAKASSPEAAAAKLHTIGEYPPAKLVKNAGDLTLLFDDCGIIDYDGLPGLDIEHYSDFAPFFRYALQDARNKDKKPFLETEKGVQFINAMVLLASMFLDKTKEKGKSRDLVIFNALNMSLGDFWDAVIGTCVTTDGVIDEDRRKRMIRARDIYMMNRKPEISLKNELASLLDVYMEGFVTYGKIDHILSCDDSLYDYRIQQEEAERILDEYYGPDDDYEYYGHLGDEEPCFKSDGYLGDEEPCFKSDGECDTDIVHDSKNDEDLEQYYEDTGADVNEYLLNMDPAGYFMNKASSFTRPVDNFYDDNVMHIRRELFLNGGSYSEEDLKDMRDSIKNVCFLKQYDELVKGPDFDKSKVFCETTAMLIYHLLVFPFLEIKQYHYESRAKE